MRPQEIARVCHEANRAIQAANLEEVGPAWDDAPDWMRESTLKGVLLAQTGVTPEVLHGEWMKERLLNGWVFGLFKSEQDKTHPCLRPYDDLDEMQKLKDAVFLALVSTLS